MEESISQLRTGTHLSVSIQAPCGFALIEGAVIANVSGRYIKIILPATTSPKLEHISIGTKVSLTTDNENDQFACSGVVNNLDERPFIWIKTLELLPAIAKRRHKRISVNLPMFCSVVDDDGSITVIYDGKKDNGAYEPADLSLSAGGFKLKTPFRIKDESMAIAVFFSPDDTEWMVPVFSKSVYSYPSPAQSSFLTGFRFSMINSRDRKKIDTLVREHLQSNNPVFRTRKYPSCLLRIRNSIGRTE